MSNIEISDIRHAQKVLLPQIHRTRLEPAPQALQRYLTQPCEVYFKFENEQLTGSFKLRGALNKMKSLSSEELSHGVVASSAGNHAQGVAFGAKEVGAKAHIVMPLSAPLVKVTATKSYGAEVILHGDFYDEAYAHARALEKERGYVFIHPYEDPHVIAGQGTIGLEIFEDLQDLDSIVIPIGGGGLISGVATALKALNPKIKIYGVVSNQAAGMRALFRGEPSQTYKKKISTIADGIAIKNPSSFMYKNYLSRLMDDVIEVGDDEIGQAILFLLEKSKTVAEGSGAAGLAAVFSGKLNLGKKCCVLISGGNIDLSMISKVIERGQRRDHRLARLAVVVEDLPGNLTQLTSIFSLQRANILEVYHDRVSPDLGLRETRIDFLIETSSDEHLQQIENALKAAGCRLI